MTRSELEKKLIKRFGRVLSSQERMILDAVDGGDTDARLIGTNEFWREQDDAFPWFVSLLVQGAMFAADQSLPDSIATREPIIEKAREWAEHYALDRIKGINATSYRQTASVMDKWFTGELNRQQLEDALGTIFSPDRAARIGITETTQAVTMGKLRAADEMKMLGFVPHYIWHQNSDYDGCGCDVLDGTEVEEGLVPPLHVNCNCDIEVRYEIPEDPGENITMAEVEALLAGKMATMAQYAVENALKAATGLVGHPA